MHIKYTHTLRRIFKTPLKKIIKSKILNSNIHAMRNVKQRHLYLFIYFVFLNRARKKKTTEICGRNWVPKLKIRFIMFCMSKKYFYINLRVIYYIIVNNYKSVSEKNCKYISLSYSFIFYEFITQITFCIVFICVIILFKMGNISFL